MIPSWLRVDTIRVEVHPERFAFQTERGAFELPAWVHPTDAHDVQLRVLRRVPMPAAPVPLFGPSTAGSGAMPKARLLAIFFTRALIRCVGDRVLKLKPHVVFAGASTLDAVLSGYQYEVLLQAAFDAGARTVRFEPLPGEEISAEYTRRVTQEEARRSTWHSVHGR